MQPSENIAVTNCAFRAAGAGLKLGAENLADLRNAVFSNCVITDSRFAVAIHGYDGGLYEHVSFSNITIETGRPNTRASGRLWLSSTGAGQIRS